MRRLIALTLITTTIAGCAPGVRATRTTPVATRGGQTDPTVMHRYAQSVPPGSVVNIRMTDGSRLKATFLLAERDHIVVKPRTRIPEPDRRVAIGQIDSLEIERGGVSGLKALGIGIAGGAAGFFAMFLILYAAYGGD
jgi:hypothetical protein